VLPLAIEFSLMLLNHKSDSDSANGLGKVSQNPDLHFVFPVVKRGSEKIVYSHDYAKEWSTFLNESPYGDYSNWFELISVGNKQGIIGIEEIKNLHKKMFLKAFNGKKKVCILWGVEKMNSQEANSFLKILEEPPNNTYFFLIAENTELVLPTLLSRCQQITLGPINSEALRAVIPDKKLNIDQIILQAEGDYNLLKGFLEDSRNVKYEELLVKVLRLAFKAKGNKSIVGDLINWSAELSSQGREEQKAFLAYGIQFLRDAFLLNYKLESIVYYRSSINFDLSKLAPYIHSQNVLELIKLFENTHYYVIRNANAKMIFSNLALKLTRLINLSKS
jgi:DNA polymerase-3 subunit delta'